MTDPTRKRLVLMILALYLNLQTSNAAAANTKPLSRPVHEVISEQSRSDSKVRTGKSPTLPYGNPLAGNSQQNARLHAQNQQAMFNAERVRQHRAQLQRWTKAPQMDSYMKAYHESQENHQFALEQQQSKLKEGEIRQAPPGMETKLATHLQAPAPQTLETTKITKADAVTSDKSRSHRSYGSDHRHFAASQPQNIYVSPAPAYDQGVSIKPHGNIGINQLQQQDTMQLYTQAVPSSETQYIYPKQHNQMKQYQSSQEIDALNSLLKKNPQDQLSQLNVLLQSSKDSSNENFKESDIETPIDLYFYLKDPPSQQTLPNEFEPIKYEQMTPSFPVHMHQSDHKPITEEIDDIADPNMHKKYKYSVKPIPERSPETTTLKSHNYYKVEVASQTITSGLRPTYKSKLKKQQNTEETKPMFQTVRYAPAPPTAYKELDYAVSNPEDTKPLFKAVHYTHINSPDAYAGNQDVEDKTRYQTVTYEQPESPTYVQKDPNYQQDTVPETYMHHNSQFNGVQHLAEDGSVTAYADGDENVSNKNLTEPEIKTFSKPKRNRRSNDKSQLDTNFFLIPNTTFNVTKSSNFKSRELSANDTASAEALRVRYIRNRKPFGPHNTFLLTPEFPVGEAADINTDYDYDIGEISQRHKNHKYDPYDKLVAYDDSEDDYDEYTTDFSSPDDELSSPLQRYHPVRTYAPNNVNYNQNIDLKTGFSNYRTNIRRPNLNALLNTASNFPSYGVPRDNYRIPSTAYGIPATSYGLLQDYSAPNYVMPQSNYGPPFQFGNQLSGTKTKEPIYMLTESQLKNLVGHHNLNIGHLDVFQIAKNRRPPYGRPKTGYRGKRYPHGRRPRNLKKNLYKLNRLLQ